jgi:hypothetical protein
MKSHSGEYKFPDDNIDSLVIMNQSGNYKLQKQISTEKCLNKTGRKGYLHVYFLLHVHSSILLSTEYTECQHFCPVIRIGPPTPSSASECCSPPLSPRGETHLLVGEGVGRPNSNEGSDTLVLYVHYNPSTLLKR